jgi:hypothetical protein
MAGKRGEVRYRVTSDTGDFTSGLKKATAEWNNFKKALAGGVVGAAAFSVGEKAVAALASSIKSVPAAIAESVKAAAAFGDAMSNAATRTGFGAEALQKLNVAGKLAGVGFEEIQASIGRMQKAIESGDEAFVKLGLTARELKALSPEQAFEAVGQALASIANPTEQAALSMELFGKSGAKFLGIFGAGADEAKARAKELGLVMSGDMVRALDAFGDRVDLLGEVWDRLWINIGAGIASSPEVISALDTITNALGAVSKAVGELTSDFVYFVSAWARTTADNPIVKFFADGASEAERARMAIRTTIDLLGIPFGNVGGIVTGGADVGRFFKDLDFQNYKTKGTAGQLADFMGEKPTGPDFSIDAMNAASDARIKKTNELREAQEKLRREAEAAITAALNFQDKVTHGVEAGIKHMFDEQGRIWREQLAAADLSFLDPDTMKVPMRRGPDLSGVMAGVASGAIVPGAGPTLKEATTAGVDFSRMLVDVAHAFQLLGVGPSSVLGRFVGSLTVIGASIDNIIKGQKGSGIAGFLGTATGVLGIASAGFSLLKGLFGGPSKEERAAAEAERKRQQEEALRKAEEAERKRAAGAELAITATKSLLDTILPTRVQHQKVRRDAQGQPILGPDGKPIVKRFDTFEGGLQGALPDDIRSQGSILRAGFQLAVQEQGLAKAAQQFADVFARFKDAAGEAGVDTSAVDTMGRQIALGTDERFVKLAEAAGFAADALKGFGDASFLSAETFEGLANVTDDIFQRALAAGAGDSEALALVMPNLAELSKKASEFGFELPQNIQELLSKAAEEGFKLPTSVAEKQLGVLEQIRDAINGLPSYAGGGRVGRETDGRGGGGGGAAGGGQLAWLHDGETVVRDEDAASFAQSVLGNSGSVESALAVLAAEVRRGRDEEARPQLAININAPGATPQAAEAIREAVRRELAAGSPTLRRLDKRYARRS